MPPLDDFTRQPTEDTPDAYPKDNGPFVSQCYAFSIRQHNWRACVAGPDVPSVHGEKNVNQPWQGVGINANIHPPNLRQGALVVARRTYRGGNKPHGAKGIWRYRSCSRTDKVPWTDDQYEWVLYCERVDRKELPQAIDEQMSRLPFHQNKFFGAVNVLHGHTCRAYLSRLMDSGILSEQEKDALRNG